MAEARIPAAKVKPQTTPGVEAAQVMVPISDAAPLSIPLRILSVQQMALVLQQGRQKIEAMYEEKNRLGQEIAVAQSTKRSLQLDVTFETEKKITRVTEAKALTHEKHLLEQEISGFKEQIQLLDGQLKVLTREKHQHMQDIRTASSAKDKVRHEVQVLEDEKHKLGREMLGAKALYDKLSAKTLAANRECNRLGQIIIQVKAEHDRVTQENRRLIIPDIRRRANNTKEDIVSQEIQIAEKAKEQLMEDILSTTTAANAELMPAVNDDSVGQEECSSGTPADLGNVGRARSISPTMVVFCVISLCLFTTWFPLLSITIICMGLWILKFSEVADL